MNNVWAVYANKGGCLKTSIVTNIAGILKVNHKVLVVDMDSQGNAATAFGLNPDKLTTTIYDVLQENKNPTEAIINVYNNIDLLPSNDDMSFFEFGPTVGNSAPTALRRVIDRLRNQYDIILIDTPPSTGKTIANVMLAADKLLIPFQPEPFSMRSLQKVISLTRDFQTKYNRGLTIVGVVPTLVKKQTVLHKQVLKQTKEFCVKHGIPILDTKIPHSIRYASSVGFYKLPLTLSNKFSPMSVVYQKIWEEVSGHGE
ncbi:ParA family protein [Paenibacillus sp. TRM 82003]|nr:ParA family protein [Paenibacillus sp. TRM 82003]